VTQESTATGSEVTPEPSERTVAAGPLFLFGLFLLAFGLVRRRPIAAVAGAAAMWVDRESVLSGLRGGPS
jgi:hypothetical protein